MQNPLPFYSEYNSYPTGDAFLSNAPDASIENEGFCPPTIKYKSNACYISTNIIRYDDIKKNVKQQLIPMQVILQHQFIVITVTILTHHIQHFLGRSTDFSQGLPSGRTGTITTTSNLTTSAEEGSSDDNDEDGEENDLARKREKHTQVEAQRRALEKAHFKELSMLITNRNDSKSTKLHHLDLLKIAADQISEMNARHKHDPLRPSNLTDNELNFLTIEASNSFIFVTMIEPPTFQIIHVTDSLNRYT